MPSDPIELQELVPKLSASNAQLNATLTQQRETIEQNERKIFELLQALRGKQRERKA